jgi:hypothetical protein
VTPETESLVALDVDGLLRLARGRALPPAEVLAAARRRNRARAFLFLQDAARRGVRSDDPKTEALLARFRRDALRERGVDERLVRGAA